jgi:hypothetical protein
MQDEDYDPHHRKFELTEKRLISREREILRYQLYQQQLEEERLQHLRINNRPTAAGGGVSGGWSRSGSFAGTDEVEWPPTPMEERTRMLHHPPVWGGAGIVAAHMPSVLGVFAVVQDLYVDQERLRELRRRIQQTGYGDRKPGPVKTTKSASSNVSLLPVVTRLREGARSTSAPSKSSSLARHAPITASDVRASSTEIPPVSPPTQHITPPSEDEAVMPSTPLRRSNSLLESVSRPIFEVSGKVMRILRNSTGL